MRESLRPQQECCAYAAAPAVPAPAGMPSLSSRADSRAAGTFPDTDMDRATASANAVRTAITPLRETQEIRLYSSGAVLAV